MTQAIEMRLGGWRDANGSKQPLHITGCYSNIQVIISIQIQSGKRGSMQMHKHVVAVTHIWRQCAPERKETATSLQT
jgi:hypothetical protein